MYELSVNEKGILRDLASQYMAIASLPIQKEKIKLWKALNRGEMIKPMVCIDQLPWNELNYDGSLTEHISDPFWRAIETNLRQAIYKWNNFPVDMVLDPFIPIPMDIISTGYGTIIQEESLSRDTTSAVLSHHYINQLNEMEDVSKIKDMHFTHNINGTKLRMDMAKEIFGGIAPVMESGVGFHLGVWDFLSTMMGVEAIYFDVIERPEFLHALMKRLTESVVCGIKEANELMIHDDNINMCHCSYIYTDELLPDSAMGKGHISKNSWAFGLAQLFTSVSPATTKEFEIPYITTMAKEFGGLYYGCCDRLDDRMDLILNLPNIRKISCSPWSNRDAFAEKIGKVLTMSNKPTPAFIAGDAIDYAVIEKDLKHTFSAAKSNNVNLELILKDVSTVNYQPQRLTQWADIAMRLAENY